MPLDFFFFGWRGCFPISYLPCLYLHSICPISSLFRHTLRNQLPQTNSILCLWQHATRRAKQVVRGQTNNWGENVCVSVWFRWAWFDLLCCTVKLMRCWQASWCGVIGMVQLTTVGCWDAGQQALLSSFFSLYFIYLSNYLLLLLF